jgi:hypothetical protein
MPVSIAATGVVLAAAAAIWLGTRDAPHNAADPAPVSAAAELQQAANAQDAFGTPKVEATLAAAEASETQKHEAADGEADDATKTEPETAAADPAEPLDETPKKASTVGTQAKKPVVRKHTTRASSQPRTTKKSTTPKSTPKKTSAEIDIGF